jgi:hypothetical protein
MFDWQKVEEEFLSKTDTCYNKRYEIMFNIKTLRLKENLKKILKNAKIRDEVIINNSRKRLNERSKIMRRV